MGQNLGVYSNLGAYFGNRWRSTPPGKPQKCAFSDKIGKKRMKIVHLPQCSKQPLALHNGLIAQFDDSISNIHPYSIWSNNKWLHIRPSKNILYWIFFRGEYFSGVNIVQGWIFFRGEYFSGVHIFQGWIFFRGEYFEYGVIMNDSVSDTESYFRYGVII